MNPLVSSVYPEDDPFRIPFPKQLLKVAQDQYRNNEEARAARVREVLCPFRGAPNSQTDLVPLFVEHPNLEDDDLADALGVDITEVMQQVWETRPISIFDCLVPSCRAPIPVRNRKHLLRLLRVEKYFDLKVAAGDLVEFKTLCEMLCDSCSLEMHHCLDEKRRAELLALRARQSELRVMARNQYEKYLGTPELKAKKSRARIRAGNRCQVCGATDKPLEVHHNDYSELGAEPPESLVVLCRPCHQHFHGILPEAA
jgi:5-methylcytosine-specific restriction endonuclease McrA